MSVTQPLVQSYTLYATYDLTICETAEDRRACRQLCDCLVQDPIYGVHDVNLVRQWLAPLDQFKWIAARSRHSGAVVGTFRLQEDYDLARFSNISAEGRAYRRTHRLVDIGASIVHARRQRAVIFEGLFTLALKYLLEAGILGVYIQVQPYQVVSYVGLGFRPVTAPFQPAGFHSCYSPWMKSPLHGMIQRFRRRGDAALDAICGRPFGDG